MTDTVRVVFMGRWSSTSMLSMNASRSCPVEVLIFDSSDSNVASLLSRAVTYSWEIGTRFQSSDRNSHFTPATEQLRQGVVREHLICHQKSAGLGLWNSSFHVPSASDSACICRRFSVRNSTECKDADLRYPLFAAFQHQGEELSVSRQACERKES